MKRLAIAVVTLSSLVACVGTTGSGTVTFAAAAAGPEDAVASSPLAFDNGKGWHVVLTRATLHVGAFYLVQSLPVSGAQNTACILPGVYVAQVTSGRDVDLLSPALQPFPAPGSGTADLALAGQVWLTGGDVNTVADTTPILQVTGTASREDTVRPFAGRITIGANRIAPSSSAAAGASPICKQRIVSPITTSLRPANDGTLLLRVDPRRFFDNVDFADLPSDGANAMFADTVTGADPASTNLYQGLRSQSPYTFAWVGGT